jgi:hypothetical protein
MIPPLPYPAPPTRNLDLPLAIGAPHLFPALILSVDSGQCMAKLRDLSEKWAEESRSRFWVHKGLADPNRLMIVCELSVAGFPFWGPAWFDAFQFGSSRQPGAQGRSDKSIARELGETKSALATPLAKEGLMPIDFGERPVELCLKACWESELGCSFSPLLHPEQTLPSFEGIKLLRQVQRADLAPTAGYAMVVDGHFKTEFVEEGATKKAAAELLAKYPMLRIEIYDASSRSRTLLK